MKILHILCLCAAITLPQLAWAELPFAVQSFGTSQATVDFCAQIDPTTAAQYQEQGTLMVQGVPEEELINARSTDEYKEAYARVSAALGAASKSEAAEACSRLLETDKQTGKETEADKQTDKETATPQVKDVKADTQADRQAAQEADK